MSRRWQPSTGVFWIERTSVCQKEKGLFWPFDVVETHVAVEKQVALVVFKAAEAPTDSLSKLLGGDQNLRRGEEEPEGQTAVVCPSIRCNTNL